MEHANGHIKKMKKPQGQLPADDPISGYILAQPPEVRDLLRAVRETIQAAAPDATEKISWQMPTFWQRENLIHFAAFKNHIGLFPGGEAVHVFAEQLGSYKTSTGTIQLPLNKPIDHQLIADIVCWRIKRLQPKQYEYDAIIRASESGKGGAYVPFPYGLRAESGKGRLKVHATFDGEPYQGSIVNMGVKNADGSVCYILGIRKSIRQKIGKQIGDVVHVALSEI